MVKINSRFAYDFLTPVRRAWARHDLSVPVSTSEYALLSIYLLLSCLTTSSLADILNSPYPTNASKRFVSSTRTLLPEDAEYRSRMTAN